MLLKIKKALQSTGIILIKISLKQECDLYNVTQKALKKIFTKLKITIKE